MIDNNTIELYNPNNDTSYFLNGYQRNYFDYDFIFYDNIHYFLQEYEAWEKTYTSEIGAINEFDNENYLQFLAGGNDSTFQSSQDYNISNVNNIYWDYTGIYGIQDVANNDYLKTLTLDYDYFDNEFFELNVIDDGLIELYHPSSGTYYEFTGRGYILYMKNAEGKGPILAQFDVVPVLHPNSAIRSSFERYKVHSFYEELSDYVKSFIVKSRQTVNIASFFR